MYVKIVNSYFKVFNGDCKFNRSVRKDMFKYLSGVRYPSWKKMINILILLPREAELASLTVPRHLLAPSPQNWGHE